MRTRRSGVAGCAAVAAPHPSINPPTLFVRKPFRAGAIDSTRGESVGWAVISVGGG
jgi:hypothetical protein